ncbi:MAG: bifunctional serine/threonine-protein kinase/formylglycine-generating enzyme family protein [Acidobacteriota bacterium]
MPTSHTIAGDSVLEGKYHLELRLGQGGMGVVYKARHAYLKTQLAIKVILPDLVGNDPQLVTRFRQEALAAAAIRHQNVVSVTDYGVVNGSMPFLVMEYVEGESLHDLLAREKKLSPEQAFELMSAVCAGVGAAHHQGIVHRDLKPLNIMICSDRPNLSQAVKILDFGLAKIKSGELLGSFIQAQTTGLMGSPYYMAPEQWADEDPDTRADIYSLGVMLYQMLAGDVPFKGSSIPAIMKRHIADPPPPFSERGVDVPPALERAVFHTLEKDPARRTASVEDFVEEMRAAIQVYLPSIHSTMGQSQSLPVSSLRIMTRPPASKVYVDNIAVGETTLDGELLLDGVQSGNHHLRVSKSGFQDWLGDVVCDGSPREVVAELRTVAVRDVNAIPRPSTASDISYPNFNSESQTRPFNSTAAPVLERTIQQNAATYPPEVSVTTAPAKKSFFSPLILGITGILSLLLLGIVGLGAAYTLGFFSPGKTVANNANNSNVVNKATPEPSATPAVATIKPDVVSIPGGTFKMGRNNGRDEEKPEHPVTVKPFSMDRTEVTNAEYYAFVSETGYKPLPSHWVNDKPKPGQEQMPVRDVNIDDVNAFAVWRSKRDSVTYRLPSEDEWEYAARNGAKDNLYPWGDTFRAKCAVIDKPLMEPGIAGSSSCPDEWGVVDLIGNVYEWTGSKAEPYPGSDRVAEPTEVMYAIRGGCAQNKSTGEYAITSTYRQFVPIAKRDLQLGFRLVSGG